MHSYRRGEQLLAIALTLLAGFVDSIGFLYLGGVFLSFMSGNTTRFTTAAVEGDHHLAMLAGTCLVMFVFGVIVGALVNRLATRRWDITRAREAVMCTVALLFCVSSLLVALDAERAATLVLSVAIGTVNSVFERGGEVAVPLTYTTGTLVKMGQRFVDAFFGGDHFKWISNLLLWFGLACGSMGGAAVFGKLGIATVYVVTVYMLVVTIITLVVRNWRRKNNLPL